MRRFQAEHCKEMRLFKNEKDVIMVKLIKNKYVDSFVLETTI